MIPHPTIQHAVEALASRLEASDYSLGPIIDLATLVANADGTIDEQEMAALGTWLGVLLQNRVDEAGLESMIRSSVDVVNAAGVEARGLVIAEVLTACDVVEQGLTLALAIAFASEGLSPVERDAITNVARAPGTPPERLEALIAAARAACEPAA